MDNAKENGWFIALYICDVSSIYLVNWHYGPCVKHLTNRVFEQDGLNSSENVTARTRGSKARNVPSENIHADQQNTER